MKKKICLLFVLMLLICSTILSACNSGFIAKFSSGVNEYDFVINVDNHTAKVSQQTKYFNNSGQELNYVMFHTYANAFNQTAVDKPVSSVYQQKAYYNGFDEGGIEIESVKCNGADVKFEYVNADKTLLKVELENCLNNNQSVKLDFNYILTIPNINHRFGYGENVINVGNFYPIACVFEDGKFNESGYHYNGDPFYSTMANYNAKITFNKGLTCIATGDLLNETEYQDKCEQTYNAKAVRDFCFVLGDKFQKQEDVVCGTTVSYYYYKDENPKQSLKLSVKAVETFNDMFGKYPYSQLNVVQSNFVHGGMEFPNLVLISDELDKVEDYNQTIVHEIAHQWWYGMVGNNQFDYGWLDEGLAEYSTALFFEQNPEFNIEYNTLINNAESSYFLFVDVYTDIFKELNENMSRKLNEFETEPEYVYMAYVKPVLMYDSLREIIGLKKLIKCLNYYFEQNQGKIATPQSLINCFNKCSKQNLSSFFDNWINGKIVIKKP